MLSLLLACSASPTDTGPAPVDHTTEWPAPGADGIGFATPEYTIPAFTDQEMCTLFTYTGDTVGVVGGDFYQDTAFGHHVVIMVSNADEDEYPDGSSWNCTRSEDLKMEDLEPLLFPNGDDDLGDGVNQLILPEGLGIKLKSGTRILVQSHHINTTADAVVLNDAINLRTTPEDQVQTWAAPWVHTETELNIPVGESEITVNCTWEQDAYLLNVLGHMHEWGRAFSIDWTHVSTGETERLYDIPAWDVQYRDAPPITNFAPDSFQVKKGDTFTTTCAWTNDTDAALGFPNEMCVAVGMSYPTVVPLICEEGE